MPTKLRSYKELSRLETFEERFNYLKIGGSIGSETFGYDRYLNQALYNSPEWKRVRDIVIIRDAAYDLGVEGYEINGIIIIHHMNPITVEDVMNHVDDILNPDYLIATSHKTHNAIHYGDSDLLPKNYVERRPNDMCPWKH